VSQVDDIAGAGPSTLITSAPMAARILSRADEAGLAPHAHAIERTSSVQPSAIAGTLGTGPSAARAPFHTITL
jgi:hypothetical protein